MTRYTPLWQQAGSYPANYDRTLLSTLWPVAGATGAIAATVVNTMNVSIPAGSLAVPLQAGQNTALCVWDAAEVVTSPAAPAAGNSRVDVVIAQVRDPLLDSGVNNDFIFLVVAGTPATSNPVVPAVPTNAAPVCQYTVGGGVANLNGSTIVDRRRPVGLFTVFASITERDTLWPSPPDGARCWVPFTGSGGARGLDFVRNNGAWSPVGLAVSAVTAGNVTISGDATWANIPFATINRNTGGGFDGTTWTVPLTGTVRVSAFVVIAVGTGAGGFDAVGDYHASLRVNVAGLTPGLGAFNGRFGIANVGGPTLVNVTAGQTLTIQSWLNGAAGKFKTILGGSATDSRGLFIEYV